MLRFTDYDRIIQVLSESQLSEEEFIRLKDLILRCQIDEDYRQIREKLKTR